MHRHALLEILQRYEARHPLEAEMVRRIKALVEGHADCFERSCRPGHITGSAWIITADRQRALLTHHRKLGRWLQLGGHADGEVDVQEVALREAREESGLRQFRFARIEGTIQPLDIDVHVIPARYDAAGRLIEDAHEHHDVRFLLIFDGDEPIRTSDESHAVAWFTYEEVRQLSDEESLLRMADKVVAMFD